MSKLSALKTDVNKPVVIFETVIFRGGELIFPPTPSKNLHTTKPSTPKLLNYEDDRAAVLLMSLNKNS